MTRRTVIALVLGALGVAAATAALLGEAAPESATGTATVEDVRLLVDGTGRLEAAIAYEVGPPSVPDIWNYNLKWMISEGRRVSRGDVVLRFDTTDLDERIREYEAQREKILQEREKEQRDLDVKLRQQRLDLVEAEGKLRTAEVELSVPEELVSSTELQKLHLDRELASKRVDFLREKMAFESKLVESKLELLDVKLQRVEQLLATTKEARSRHAVTAPIDGLVVYVPKRNGDRWEVGERVWMMAKVLEIADVSSLRVEAEVLEVDAARVERGQRAEVRLDALPGRVLRTRVDEVGRLVRERSEQDRTKIFDVRLPVPEVDPELMRPGMGVRIDVEVAVLPDRVTVPLQAVRASAEGASVRLPTDSGPETRPVRLGPRVGDRVVVEDGLSGGETLLLDGAASS